MPREAPIVQSGIAARAPFRADIQGMRAIAVLLVVIYHAGLPIPGGYVGVDVFFVISGFLITNHLLSEVTTGDRLDFGRFYARRARRILPASFVVLAATALAAVLVMPPVLLRTIMQDAAATALYVPNMLFAWRGTDYLAETAPSSFQHYWSLGVEEQFYLLWPLALVVLWRLARRNRRVLTVCVVGLVTVSFLIGLWLTAKSGSWAFFSLPSRAWELGAGALVAIAGPGSASRLGPRSAALLGWCGVAAIVVSAFLFDASTPFPGWSALVPVSGAAAVIFAGQQPSAHGPAFVLGIRPFQFVGAISYSLYLVHWPLQIIPTYLGGKQAEPPLAVTAALGVAAVPLAWLLWRFVENPARSSRWLTARRPAVSLWAAATASVLVVAASLGVIFALDHRPLTSDRESPESSVPARFPEFTGYVPSNVSPPLGEVAQDLPAIYAAGCHLPFEVSSVQSCSYGDLGSATTVVLFGDSHAAQWFPALEALAVENGFRLDVFTKSSCPSVDVPILVKNAPYESCETWREGVIARIAEIEPAVVLLANLADYPDQGAGGISDEAWAAGLASTIRRMPASASVAVIADTPAFGQTPAICLSANLESAANCSMLRADVIDAGRSLVEFEVAAQEGASYLDFNDWICGRDECGAIIGNTVVYRDAHHLTATFAEQLAPVVWEQLGALIDRTRN